MPRFSSSAAPAKRKLFRATFGGYGGLGIITEVELELDLNARIERFVQDVELAAYPFFFVDNVLHDRRSVLHSAALTPPDFREPCAITWLTSEEPLTQTARLRPRGADYTLDKAVIWALTELPGGASAGKSVIEPMLLNKKAVVWRNHEASLDAASLGPSTRGISTYLLQEYFIPVANFLPFVESMAHILKSRRVNALYVSIRHSPADGESLLRWAPTDVFAFVLYYKLRSRDSALREAAVWTRELIDAALVNGGRYYLPYRLDATRAQFERAYPESRAFDRLKARVDPRRRLRNLLWDKYLAAA